MCWDPSKRKCKDHSLIIVGPGGTGKTAVLKLTEALVVFFAGQRTVHKMAPSNTAARLLGGDTLHALCKLPYGNVRLTSKRGRLTSHSLRHHRKTWRETIAGFIDEISMVAADQFLQCDVRLRQAKMQSEQRFGGLAMTFSGDFLQLPPVDKDGRRKSLVHPMDEAGRWEPDEAQEDEVQQAAGVEADQEARQGHALWRSLTRVVCLTVNIRAPGAQSPPGGDARWMH